MLKVASVPPSQFGHGASDGLEKVFRPTILVQIGRLRHWSYMSDHDNVSVRQSHIEMKIELAFAAGMSMSFDGSIQHDFILTEAAFDREPQINLTRQANDCLLDSRLRASVWLRTLRKLYVHGKPRLRASRCRVL